MKLNKSEICALVITLLFLALVLGYHLGNSRGDTRIVLTEMGSAQTPSPEMSAELEAIPEKININTATAGELETLDGIGPALAQRIIDYRTEHGDFERIEDIAFVSGIASEVYEAIREHITVD